LQIGITFTRFASAKDRRGFPYMKIEKTFLSDKSDEALLEELKRVAQIAGMNSVTQAEFKEHGGRVSVSTIEKRFNGWNNALKRAGLNIARVRNIPDEEIFSEIGRVWNHLGRKPTYDEFNKLATVSCGLLERRFGTFLKAMDAFIQTQGIPKPLPIPSTVSTPAREAIHAPQTSIRRNKMKYGALVNFRGMQHAPLNEFGVVFLFGMLAKELGFIVEAIGAPFPDCQAKRLDQDGQFYKNVMIEFEYYSSAFRKHRHDPARCDLIVCWKHDWKDCPIEVLELSKIVEQPSAESARG
jgi:hypothetical protein